MPDHCSTYVRTTTCMCHFRYGLRGAIWDMSKTQFCLHKSEFCETELSFILINSFLYTKLSFVHTLRQNRVERQFCPQNSLLYTKVSFVYRTHFCGTELSFYANEYTYLHTRSGHVPSCYLDFDWLQGGRFPGWEEGLGLLRYNLDGYHPQPLRNTTWGWGGGRPNTFQGQYRTT